MRLIRCYIEQFGGLSQYALDLSPGLTVVQEPNGFGKTTLAEFIRAMFYGFPARAGKSLDRNLRKKYLPWQGGTCGGNLVFEYQGSRYRLERTFGDTPRQDTFALYDEDTGLKSDRFTRDVGLELFQLDGDSFLRSAYLPQAAPGSLATDSIRAKLGDLVEDTNDVNNFESAVAALKKRRSALAPYNHGRGGSIAEAERAVSSLQEELAQSADLDQEMERRTEEIAALEEEKRQREAEREEVRARIIDASEAAARKAVAGEYGRMRQQLQEAQEAFSQVREKYPGDLPEEREVSALFPIFARLEALEEERVRRYGDEADDGETPGARVRVWPVYVLAAAGLVSVLTGAVLLSVGASLSGGAALALGVILLTGCVPMVVAGVSRRREREAENLRLADEDRRLDTDRAACQQTIRVFSRRYQVELDNRTTLQELRDDVRFCAEQGRRLRELDQQTEAFFQAHESILAPLVPEGYQEPEEQDIEALKAQEAQLSRTLSGLAGDALEQRKTLQELRARADRVPEREDALETWRERLDTDRRRLNQLDTAVELLQKAKDSLSQRYLGPVRENFDRYVARLGGEAGSSIDTDLNVLTERSGAARELACFSAGQTDLLMLCMRLALVDALYQKEKPFLILDDPFVNLDDQRTAEALSLLRELSQERQILYLICNSSRNVKA